MLLYRNKLIHYIPEDRHTNLCLDIKIGVQLKLKLANVDFYKFLSYMTIIRLNIGFGGMRTKN
jgi:hypothetical protein